MSDTVIDCEITPEPPGLPQSCAGMAVEVSAMLDEDTHIELPRHPGASDGPKMRTTSSTSRSTDAELCAAATPRAWCAA